jgi:Leucine-rich repeat (LRR) protein
METLQKLNLYRDKLTELLDSIAEGVGNLSPLQELHLVDNQLIALPDSIEWCSGLSSLQRLDLYGNHLTTHPKFDGNASIYK